MFAIDEAVSSGHDALPVCLWRENPHRLVSLWEMLRLKADDFVNLMLRIDSLRQTSTQVELGMKFDESSFQIVLANLAEASTRLRSLEMPVSAKAAEKASAELCKHDRQLAPAKWILRHLTESIQSELEEVYLFSIPAKRALYYDQSELFDCAVNASFPSAVMDIEEAGNCFACSRWTACVFHSMRVLEHGLRKMAGSMRVIELTDVGIAQWGELIQKIEDELDALRNARKTEQKTEELQKYSDLATNFRYFKNAWRNHVAHGRAFYNESDATRILGGVGDFMKQASAVLAPETKS